MPSASENLKGIIRNEIAAIPPVMLPETLRKM
jgi:hypothetical protein